MQRPLGKVLTDERGEFKLLGLFPAVYSVKISLAAFIPATREILVQPGMRSILNVNLSTLFSSIQFAYPIVENANIMSEDWKWVLRSAPVTRPVLRYLDIDADADACPECGGRVHNRKPQRLPLDTPPCSRTHAVS